MLVDTPILVDVFQNEPEWADWSVAQLRAQAQIHQLVINPIIYAELSTTFSTLEALDDILACLKIPVLEMPKPALFLAGKAFEKHCRQGGSTASVPSDFFIGAHAAVAQMPLLTRDARRYQSTFPTVQLIAPDTN